jgi:uncharacterized membrane protein
MGAAAEDRHRGHTDAPARAHVPWERMTALTDGVAAIAMTLLVLSIDVPPRLHGARLQTAVHEALEQIVALVISVVVIALFWQAHHAIMRQAGRLTPALFWLNVAFLALLSLIPFPTEVLQDYGDLPIGPTLYAAVVGITALVLDAMRLVLAHGTGGRPVRGWWPSAQAVVFLASIAVAQFSPQAAVYSWAAVVPLAVLIRRLAGVEGRVESEITRWWHDRRGGPPLP